MSTYSNFIACQSCKREYKRHDFAFSGGDSTYGCSSYVHGEVMHGNTGSCLPDMRCREGCWVFIGERPAWVAEGKICDFCIRAILDADLIEFQEYDTDWDNPDNKEILELILCDFKPTTESFYVTIPNELAFRIEMRAAERGLPVKDYIAEVLEKEHPKHTEGDADQSKVD